MGIGVASPAATLDVDAPSSRPACSNASTTINFAAGNLQDTSASCTTMTLDNMANGAVRRRHVHHGAEDP